MNFLTFNLDCNCGIHSELKIIVKCAKCGIDVKVNMPAAHIMEIEPCTSCFVKVAKYSAESAYQTGFIDAQSINDKQGVN